MAGIYDTVKRIADHLASGVHALAQPPQTHDNTKHTAAYEDTANKGANNGYAGLDAAAKIPVSALYTDVESNLPILDASGNVLILGNSIHLTRNVTGSVGFRERTSGEYISYYTRKSANSYIGYIYVGGGNKMLGFLDGNGDIPHMRPKAASANLRHSHDAEIMMGGVTNNIAKTITFNIGISGTLRIAFDMKNSDVGAIIRVYKNGAQIGVDQTDTSGVYVTKSQDLNVGVLAPGDTIALYCYKPGGAQWWVKNFRISYDNAPDTVVVTGVVNS